VSTTGTQPGPGGTDRAQKCTQIPDEHAKLRTMLRQPSDNNAESWDRVARRYQDLVNLPLDDVHFGHDVPRESELRILGALEGKRVVDLGCGGGQNVIAFNRMGAHAIGIDFSGVQLELAAKRAVEQEMRCEFRQGDVADLAFLPKDSVDLVFSAGTFTYVEDLPRVFRQVHRVLRPKASFVFAYDHPVVFVHETEHGPFPADPLSPVEPSDETAARRSYFDDTPIVVQWIDTPFTIYRRTNADVFNSLIRTGFQVDVLLEPLPAGKNPIEPSTIIWRARKAGV